MKKIFMLAIAVLIAVQVMAQDNTLTKKEKRTGWTLLFDGENFGGWRQYNGTQMPEKWSIEEGAMKIARNSRAGSGSGADIIFATQKYENFEISIDWKIEKEGNSGIFYYVVEQKGQAIYASAPEIQVLDNEYAGDNKLANHRAGSLYDMLPAVPENAKPFGEWNTIVIRVDNGKVTHTQNGVKVVEYTLWTPEWDALVSASKFANWPGFKDGPAKSGYIGLQDHGWATWYKNIKIRELK